MNRRRYDHEVCIHLGFAVCKREKTELPIDKHAKPKHSLHGSPKHQCFEVTSPATGRPTDTQTGQIQITTYEAILGRGVVWVNSENAGQTSKYFDCIVRPRPAFGKHKPIQVSFLQANP